MTSPVNDQRFSNQPATPISVFLLDDHEIVRQGVRDLLETDPGIGAVARLFAELHHGDSPVSG